MRYLAYASFVIACMAAFAAFCAIAMQPTVEDQRALIERDVGKQIARARTSGFLR